MFYSTWKDDWNSDEYLKMVYDNLEDTVEHLPGKLFSGNIDLSQWQKSEPYRVLHTDKELLDQYDKLGTLQLLRRRRREIKS